MHGRINEAPHEMLDCDNVTQNGKLYKVKRINQTS
jgi:hypothetical protein